MRSRDITQNHLEKGSALIIAILSVALLATIGLALVLTTQTERGISRNMASASKAIFAADTGIQSLRMFLDFDFAYDRTGLGISRGWANRWLIVPPGTSGADLTDATGNCTNHSPSHNVGLPNVTFFDLDDPAIDDNRDGNGTNDIDSNNDGLIDINKPYNINTAIPGASGTIGAEGETIQNRLNRWQIMFRNVKETPNAATYSNKRLSLLVAGISEIYGRGKNYASTSGRTQNVQGARFIEQGVAAEPISIWDNVAFLGVNDSTLLGSMKLYGSLHIINATHGTNAIEMSGNLGFFNYYRNLQNGVTENPPCCNNGPDSSLTDRLAALPVARDGQATLHSKIRIKKGNISVTSSATIGCADDPSRPGRERFEELLMNGSYTLLSKLHFDRFGVYDVPDDFLDRIKFPDTITNSQPYFDAPRNMMYANYQAYLVGDADSSQAGDYGAAALDLTPINPTNSSSGTDPWIFNNETTVGSLESVRLLDNLLNGTGTDTRGGGAANAAYITGRSMNWLTRNLASVQDPQGNPLSGGNGTIVYFGFDRTDAATNDEPVIGYKAAGDTGITWVRGGPPGSGTPVVLANQSSNHNGAYFVVKMVRYSVTQTLVNGFAYLPKGKSINSLFTNFLFHPGSSGTTEEAAAWDSIFPAALTTNSHRGMIHRMNQFLEVPDQSAGIDMNVDIIRTDWGLPALSMGSGYIYPAMTASMTKSSLIGSGIILLPGPLYFDQSGTGAGDDAGIDYDGRMTFYVPSWAPTAPVHAAPAVNGGNSMVYIRTFLYPKVQFPCNDALVVLSAGDMDTSPNPSQKREAAIFYARNRMVVGKQTDLAGSSVAYAYIDGGGSGNPNYLQVPALNGCLPDFLPGKDPITYLRPMNWVER